LEVGQDFPQDEARPMLRRKNALAVKYKMADAVFVGYLPVSSLALSTFPPVQEKVEPLT